MIAAVITAIVTFHVNPVMATPKVAPEAGGCSISTTTMMNIEIPTAIAYTNADAREDVCGINEHIDPTMIPMTCPPIKFLGFAATLLGIAKTMKVDAPIEATMTAFSSVRKKRTMAIDTVASKLWRT